MWQLGWPIGKMPPFDQNWSSESQALHTSLSIGIWQRSAFHRRKWQQINKMDKRDVILSDQAACRYDENNKYSLLYSSCHHQSPIIFTKTGFQNMCQIELYQSSATVFHKQATNPDERTAQALLRIYEEAEHQRQMLSGRQLAAYWLTPALGRSASLPAFTWNMSKGKCVEEYKHNTKEIQTEIQEKYSPKS